MDLVGLYLCLMSLALFNLTDKEQHRRPVQGQRGEQDGTLAFADG